MYMLHMYRVGGGVYTCKCSTVSSTRSKHYNRPRPSRVFSALSSAAGDVRLRSAVRSGAVPVLMCVGFWNFSYFARAETRRAAAERSTTRRGCGGGYVASTVHVAPFGFERVGRCAHVPRTGNRYLSLALSRLP